MSSISKTGTSSTSITPISKSSDIGSDKPPSSDAGTGDKGEGGSSDEGSSSPSDTGAQPLNPSGPGSNVNVKV